MAATTLAMCALLVGGVLILLRARAGVGMLRLAAIGSIVLAFVSLGLVLHEEPIYASYWSKPATCAIYAMQYVEGQAVEILIVLLTLPPLVRRMF